MTALVHRLAEPADAPALLELFEHTKPVIARLAHPAVHRAIVAEGLAHRRSVIAVSETNGRLVAYAIIAWDWQRFRTAFVLRHPRVALLVAADLWRRRRRSAPAIPVHEPADRPQTVPAGAPARERSDARWSDGGPTIAKVLFTGVHPTMRGQGVATGLKAFYVDHLRRQGFRRIDAMVGRHNVASLALQRTSGWVTRPQGNETFSYLELDGNGERA